MYVVLVVVDGSAPATRVLQCESIQDLSYRSFGFAAHRILPLPLFKLHPIHFGEAVYYNISWVQRVGPHGFTSAIQLIKQHLERFRNFERALLVDILAGRLPPGVDCEPLGAHQHLCLSKGISGPHSPISKRQWCPNHWLSALP